MGRQGLARSRSAISIAFFPPAGPARYRYFLKCELSASAKLKSLSIQNDLQMAPLTLPGMGVGTNSFTYTDRSPTGRQVRITHEWVERSASRPPEVPAEPIFPPAGGDAAGTAIVFQWQPARDPDGDAIADYHFELSESRRHEVAALDELRQAASRGRPTPARPATRCLGPAYSIPTRNTSGTSGRDDKGRLGTLEPDLELHAARPGPSKGRHPRVRPRAQPRRPSLETQRARWQASDVSRLRQRRKGLLGQ